MSGRAVEAAGDTQTLLLDKTGTITLGNRMASDFYPVGGHSEQEVADAAQLASLADETRKDARSSCSPRNASIIRARDLGGDHDSSPSRQRRGCPGSISAPAGSARVPLTQSSVGSPNSAGRSRRPRRRAVERISRAGSTPLAVADGPADHRRHRARKTSSNKAFASASTRCAPWASALSWSLATIL